MHPLYSKRGAGSSSIRLSLKNPVAAYPATTGFIGRAILLYAPVGSSNPRHGQARETPQVSESSPKIWESSLYFPGSSLKIRKNWYEDSCQGWLILDPGTGCDREMIFTSACFLILG